MEKGPLYLCFAGKDDIFQAVLDARLRSERPGALSAQDLPLEDMLLTHILLQDVLGGEEFSPVVQEVWMRESMRIFTAAIDTPGGLKTSVRRRRQSANSGGAESIPVADSAVSDSPGVERSSSYGK